ncbi:hypothetical protein FQR65_LT14876 [Abscondita terminalis]|nr:hypothetical protein FQR65_LT14876 [Abscondita terminalis]
MHGPNHIATVKNGVSAFKATGIHPYNPNAIPEYAFLNYGPEPRQHLPDAVEENMDEIIEERPSPSSSHSAANENEVTPTKDILNKINPVPKTKKRMLEERKVAKLAKCDKDTSKKSKLKKVVDGHATHCNSVEIGKTVKNGVSAFKVTEIHPYNPNAIPEYAFLNYEPEPRQHLPDAVEENMDELLMKMK